MASDVEWEVLLYEPQQRPERPEQADDDRPWDLSPRQSPSIPSRLAPTTSSPFERQKLEQNRPEEMPRDARFSMSHPPIILYSWAHV